MNHAVIRLTVSHEILPPPHALQAILAEDFDTGSSVTQPVLIKRTRLPRHKDNMSCAVPDILIPLALDTVMAPGMHCLFGCCFFHVSTLVDSVGSENNNCPDHAKNRVNI